VCGGGGTVRGAWFRAVVLCAVFKEFEEGREREGIVEGGVDREKLPGINWF